MRTLFAEGTRRLDSKPAAYELQVIDLGQMLINDTQQSLWKTRDSIRTIPVLKPKGRKHRLCFIRVNDKPASVLVASTEVSVVLLSFFPPIPVNFP